MIIITFFIACVVIVLFVIFGPEPEAISYNSALIWFKLVVRFLYKLIRFRERGVLQLDESLVYIAGGGDDRCSMKISPKNHKVEIAGIRINKGHLDRYKKLCGYDQDITGGVPICYVESLFLKSLVCVVTSNKFCLSPLGLIHLRQTITQHEPLQKYINDTLQANVKVTQYRCTDRGVEVDISLYLLAERNKVIWEGVVTLISMKAVMRNASNEHERNDVFQYSETISVSADCGIQYSKLTGDWNPHHLYSWTAKPFGYRSPIAHGMWTLSRALAEIDKRCGIDFGRRLQISCFFKRPLFMPSRVLVKFDDPDSYQTSCCKICVEEVDSGVPHLVATLKIDM